MDPGPQDVHAGDGLTHCACGCGESLEGKKPGAKFFTDGCRVAAWKRDREDPAARRRRRDREAKRAARAEGRIASDERVSVRRAVDAVALGLQMTGMVSDRREAEFWAGEWVRGG